MYVGLPTDEDWRDIMNMPGRHHFFTLHDNYTGLLLERSNDEFEIFKLPHYYWEFVFNFVSLSRHVYGIDESLLVRQRLDGALQDVLFKLATGDYDSHGYGIL